MILNAVLLILPKFEAIAQSSPGAKTQKFSQNAQKPEPATSSAAYRTASRSFDRGDFTTVLKLLEQPKTPEECILLGRTYNLTTIGDGTPSFQRAGVLDHYSPKSLLYMALGYINVREYGPAEKAIRGALSKAPNDNEIKSTYGRFLYRQGQGDEGFSLMNAALSKAPTSQICLENLATSYAEAFESSKAAALYSRLVAAKPGIVEPLLLRSRLYAERGDTKNALADFDAIFKINPDCQVGYFQRATLWQKLKKYENVDKDCDKCIACKGKNFVITRRCMRAKVDAEERLHRFAKAAETSKYLTKDSEKVLTSWGARGDVLRRAALLEKTGKYAEALQALDPLYKFAPNRTEVMMLRARILGKSGNFKESLFLCNKLIAIDPNMGGWYRMRARALNGLGDKAAAARDLEKSKTLGETIPELGEIYKD